MKNILYYVKRFGHKSFQEFPFNEVDSLILSQVSYMNLDNFVPGIDDTSPDVSLIELLNEQTIKELTVDTLDEKNNKRLLRLFQKSTRYEGLKANHFANYFQAEKVQQFCAVTFLFDEFSYIAYRGTDLTLVGWQENFNMAVLDVIPSQEEASKYLFRVIKHLKNDFYLGGHSKGGNLALYAALYCGEDIQDRILHIYNHDGPGFQTNIFLTKEYKRLENRVSKTTCEEALVGILLYTSNRMKFVKARGLSLFQHDPFNWLITKDGRFRYVKNSNLLSKTFEKTMHDFIESTSLENRKIFLSLFFKVGMESKKSTILDIFRHPIRYIRGIRKRFKNLKPQQRIFLKTMLKKYRTIWRFNFKTILHAKKEEV